ncbi:hypothetical protein MXB_1550, partial [Myxobolus squamalis]
SKLFDQPCQGNVFLAETVPTGLKFKTDEFLPSIGESLINMIRNAKISIDIASIYSAFLNDQVESISSDRIGSTIYNELVKATERVHILVEHKEENFKVLHALKSLHQYNKISIKRILIPDGPIKIPFARLFHSKMCIGSDLAWLGTSNITPDYFYSVSGIGCTIFGNTQSGASLINSMTKFFDRYYTSDYSTYVDLSK